MDELSLYVLDIVKNSVSAGADEIEISLFEDEDFIRFSVKDDGCGMEKEQLKKVKDPFFTTRTTRKVGFGIPFLTMLAEMTGGTVKIESIPRSEGEMHGTYIEASFGKNHIDCLPIGDMASTVTVLIQGSPDIHFIYLHKMLNGEVTLDTDELHSVLGNIKLSEPEILSWIDKNLRDQYREISK